jgi:hypothetical protein
MTHDLTHLAGSEDYRRWLSDLKQRVERARQRATASANRELIKRKRSIFDVYRLAA